MHLAYSSLLLESTRKSDALSALTSFCAWFMICTISVSMLIISWNIDLHTSKVKRQENVLMTTYLTTESRKSLTNFWWWTLAYWLA